MTVFRKIMVAMVIGVMMTSFPGMAEAGLVRFGWKMGEEVVKIVKRQFPGKMEKNLLHAGTRTRFKGMQVVKRNDTFDPYRRDALGRTNRQRMCQGFSPIGNDGLAIQLHHHQQRKNGPVIEMTATEHRQATRDLHRYTRKSEIDRQGFNRWKQDYWRDRCRNF
ncbi:MAG: HNH/ENDO VII family nuclease [Desulfotignum sp.]|nr:HNH/ENDO VII family nuclease [Desulfotignum sp.]MCF8089609.1 HNH/ENDO VII family nuclease [Desulfotignum sp.]